MKFAEPPIRTPFNDPKQSGTISAPWQKWMQGVSIQLSTATTPVTGSKGGNAALASLIAVLVSKGIIADQSTP
jgi:hypothetical protein